MKKVNYKIRHNFIMVYLLDVRLLRIGVVLVRILFGAHQEHLILITLEILSLLQLHVTYCRQ